MFEALGTLAGIIILYYIEEWRKQRMKNKKLDNTVRDNNIIYPVIRKCLHKYNASRVFVLQFHNGEKFYSSKCIQRMSISHEVVSEGTFAINRMFTDVIITEEIHNIMYYLNENEMYSEDNVIQTGDKTLQTNMEIYKIKSLYCFPLRNQEGSFIGLLTFNFDTPKGLSNFDIAEISYLKNEIETVLNN